MEAKKDSRVLVINDIIDKKKKIKEREKKKGSKNNKNEFVWSV